MGITFQGAIQYKPIDFTSSSSVRDAIHGDSDVKLTQSAQCEVIFREYSRRQITNDTHLPSVLKLIYLGYVDDQELLDRRRNSADMYEDHLKIYKLKLVKAKFRLPS